MRMRVLSRAPVAHHVSRDLAGRTQQLVGGVLGTVWSYFSSIDSLVCSECTRQRAQTWEAVLQELPMWISMVQVNGLLR